MGRLFLVSLVVFFANAVLLVLQLVAGRLLAPYIGSSLETWTSVIGMFLAGISAGNWAGGRLADKAASGATLRILLWLGAASMLSTLGIVKVLGDGTMLRPLTLYPRIAATSFLICFPTAFILSLTTPVAIKLLLPDVRRTGRVVGMVYALGTLGSLVGNFATGFGFMAHFGITAIILGAAAVLAVLGLLVPPGSAKSSTEYWKEEAELGKIDVNEVLSLPAACMVVFIGSFCSMGLELGASRMLAPTLGMSIYTWTGIIGVVLAGVVAGNYLGGWVADRWPKRDTLSGSLFWCGLFTLLIIVLFALGNNYSAQVEGWINRTFGTVVAGEDGTERVTDSGYILQAKIITYALALFFLPMVAFGTISPQATRLAVRDWDHAGRVAGRVYAWSCAGAIVGTFATGWFLVGRFGVLWVILGFSLIMMVMALIVGQSWRKPKELLGTAIVLGAIVVAIWIDKEGYFQLKRGDQYVYVKETNYYLISVNKNEDDTYRDFILDHLIHSHLKGNPTQRDGKKSWEADVTFMGYGHEQVQAEFAYRAVDMKEQPHILIIGGGGYTLPRYLDAYEPTKKSTVDVVEIDPGVTEAVHVALGMPRDTRIKSFNYDGRQFIQETAKPGHYDLIIQDAVNDLSVPWHIMTKEYNHAVKKALAADGVYLLTVIDQFPDGKLLPAAIRTMQETFPHVYLMADQVFWDTSTRNVLVIAGMNQPYDEAALKAVVAKHGTGTMQTTVMPANEFKAYMEKAKPILLTDDFAPVDNLIAETFRKR